MTDTTYQIFRFGPIIEEVVPSIVVEEEIAPPPPVAGDNPAQTTGPTTEPPLYVNPLRKFRKKK